MSDMQYTRLGNSGLLVSRLCFGTMTFNSGAEWIPGVGKVDQKPATEMVSAALDAGVNFFDTADGYSHGESEIILGKALGECRTDAVICTKLGFRQSDGILDAGLNRRHVLHQIDGCLARLGTDYIDVLVLHKTDFATPMEETLAALQTAVEHGKVRYIGVSNWPAWQVARAIQYQRDNRMTPFTCGQYLYNAVVRDIELAELPMLDAMGGSLMAWSPLAGGLLSGKYDPDDLGKTADGRLAEGEFLDIASTQAKAMIKTLQGIAESRGVHMASVALAWVLAKNRTHTAIFGASKMSHLDAALAADSLALEDDDIAAIDAVAAPAKRYPQWFDTMMTDEQTTKALS
ncbi:aldo/keto reductase [Sulfitobacter sp. S190]|uniref:aldo/keto reductase n=1 Tax=Sulfitobacter sp. S190 TaxID=2867022 RepID=UPI0021A41A7F|nr:aldo/keto reductase [Sulfitobacter sp. S190]UWR22458.1 aldo/keto reductase [Sulfitobacter sp. S190]